MLFARGLFYNNAKLAPARLDDTPRIRWPEPIPFLSSLNIDCLGSTGLDDTKRKTVRLNGLRGERVVGDGRVADFVGCEQSWPDRRSLIDCGQEEGGAEGEAKRNSGDIRRRVDFVCTVEHPKPYLPLDKCRAEADGFSTKI